jgi:uncharacterized membrane protein YraQ (UPF0718 family)
MALVTSRDAALRLARAIASDLLLYNDAAIRAGKDLSGEIAEWLSATWTFAKQILPLLFVGVFVANVLLKHPNHKNLIPSI